MRGAGISEEAVVATRSIASCKKDSGGLRTCWERVVTEGTETSCALGARIGQSSPDHLQHSCRKEVKMEEEKDKHHSCKQTGE